MSYIYFRVILIIFSLRTYFVELYRILKTNDINYVRIKPCFNKDYLIYLKKLSWLDELVVLIKSNEETKPFIHSRRFNVDKIRFNNVVNLSLPDYLNSYSIVIQYSLKPYGLFRKGYKPMERIITQTIGEDKNRVLSYKIIEK